MDPKYRNRIIRNLDYLTNSTCSITTVCVTLVSRECLTISEFQIVRAQICDEQKCMELFTRLMQKPNVFEHLIEALEDSGNEHVARKLKQPTEEELRMLSSFSTKENHSEGNLKAKVTNEQLALIGDSLNNLDYMYWNNFMRKLLKFDQKFINDIEKISKTEPHSEVVHKTLSTWIHVNGDAATMECLIKTLSDSHLNYAADSLKKQLSIQTAGIAIVAK